MSDIDKDLDGAAQRLKDGTPDPRTPDPNPARVKNPSYHVFVYIDDHGVDGWRQITDETNPVSASSRKEAIKAVAPSNIRPVSGDPGQRVRADLPEDTH